MSVTLRRDPVRVEVPASSANLGPGFDAVGLALDVWDTYTAMVTDDPGVLVEVEGEGSGSVPLDESHLVVRAMALALDAAGVRPTGLVVRCVNRIPHGRGIGSSASAIVGGLALGRALLVDGESVLSDHDLLQLALRMESHPDNISASLFGGLTLSWVDDAGVAHTVVRDVHPSITTVIAVPNYAVPTDRARAVMPTHVPMADVVFNISRAAVLSEALTSRPELLIEATRDRLHQEPRRELYASSMALVDRLRELGVAAAISGAGPTVLAFVVGDDVEVVRREAPADWRVAPTPVVGGVREVPVHPGS